MTINEPVKISMRLRSIHMERPGISVPCTKCFAPEMGVVFRSITVAIKTDNRIERRSIDIQKVAELRVARSCGAA